MSRTSKIRQQHKALQQTLDDAGAMRFSPQQAWEMASHAAQHEVDLAHDREDQEQVRRDERAQPTEVVASTLRLVIDRRKLPRKPVSGSAMAVFATGRGAGTMARVELLDASWTGMGVRSPIKIEPGTSVSVLPEHAMRPRQVGIVVRCEADEGGYRLGLQCRQQKAVA